MKNKLNILIALEIAIVIFVATASGAAREVREDANLPEQDWWQHAVLYQIYPRSLRDSDGDGVGDIRGAIEKLEHFKEAGVDAVWMSPIFESPMVDFGYDISNFYDIHYEYGTMEDFDEFLATAHELGLKVLLDFVPNHASNMSEYFIKSENREEGYEDFIIWGDAVYDPDNSSNRLPPSNWLSVFGGSAWEWSEKRQQYYLHQFDVTQVDFNYRNQRVKDEMENIMTFWLDKGADGFRVDATPYLIESNPDDYGGRFPDEERSYIEGVEPNERLYLTGDHTKDLLELYEVIYEWREFIDKYNEEKGGDTRVLFVEAYANLSRTLLYYGNETHLGVHMPFNFDFVAVANGNYSAVQYSELINAWLDDMPAGSTPNWVFGNHDNPRIPNRYGEDLVDGINALDMILPGVAVTYQGDEIGMKDGYVSWEDTVDVSACNLGNPDNYLEYSRDPCRTPYQWDDTTNAGFSTGNKTWLPVGQDYEEHNLANQKAATKSHFKIYQALTTLRQEPALKYGSYEIFAPTENILAVVRSFQEYDTIILLFNVGKSQETVRVEDVPLLTLPSTVYESSLHSTRNAGDELTSEEITLVSGEALVLRISNVDGNSGFSLLQNKVYKLVCLMLMTVFIIHN